MKKKSARARVCVCVCVCVNVQYSWFTRVFKDMFKITTSHPGLAIPLFTFLLFPLFSSFFFYVVNSVEGWEWWECGLALPSRGGPAESMCDCFQWYDINSCQIGSLQAAPAKRQPCARVQLVRENDRWTQLAAVASWLELWLAYSPPVMGSNLVRNMWPAFCHSPYGTKFGVLTVQPQG